MIARPGLHLAVSLGLSALALGQDGGDPWAGDSWKRYLRSPGASVVKPARILSENTTGDVTNPEGLIDGSAVTVLRRESDQDDVPSLLIDFGINVVGLVNIHFEGSESLSDSPPGLRLAFSETEEALTEGKSDYTRSYRGVYEVHGVVILDLGYMTVANNYNRKTN
jgi:hypothetical protein